MPLVQEATATDQQQQQQQTETYSSRMIVFYTYYMARIVLHLNGGLGSPTGSP